MGVRLIRPGSDGPSPARAHPEELDCPLVDLHLRGCRWKEDQVIVLRPVKIAPKGEKLSGSWTRGGSHAVQVCCVSNEPCERLSRYRDVLYIHISGTFTERRDKSALTPGLADQLCGKFVM